MLKEQKRNFSFKQFWMKYQVWVIFAVLLLTYSVISPNFFTPVNLKNIFSQTAMPVIVAIAQLLPILTGGIDLSVSAITAYTGIIAATAIAESGHPTGVAILMAVGVGGLCGLTNGFLVSKLKFAPFIATLATTSIIRGMMYIKCGGKAIYVTDDWFTWLGKGTILGIPVIIYLSLIVVVVVALALRFTIMGRRLYAVGGNPEAARLAGINVSRYTMMAYVLSGLLCGLAGAFAACRLGAGAPTTGAEWEMDAIAAVVVGGASLSGGIGTALNTYLGALIIGWIRNILNLMGVASYPQMIIKGLIIILAVLSQGLVGGTIATGLFKKRPAKDNKKRNTLK